jgi:DNA-binding GntR family transcriptional regulator
MTGKFDTVDKKHIDRKTRSSMSDTKLDDVVEGLRQRIQAGVYGTGRLPTLRELAEQYHTSRETTGRAIKLLQAEGLLIPQGRSIYVQSRTRLAGGIADRFDLLLKQQGLTAVETVLEQPQSIAAPAAVARVLKVAEGSPVVHWLKREGTATVHYRLIEHYYPASFVSREMLDRMQTDAAFDVLEAIHKANGKVIQQIHEDILARVPNAREQRQLDIASSMPVLDMQRTGYAGDGTPILFIRITFVGSLFLLSYDYATSYWTKPDDT